MGSTRMTHAIKRRQDNYLTDPFLKEIDRAKSHLIETYPGRVSIRGDKITHSPNLQTDQTIVWLDHLRKLYIEQHHAWVLEDSLYANR
jgi:hypothetical protein